MKARGSEGGGGVPRIEKSQASSCSSCLYTHVSTKQLAVGDCAESVNDGARLKW